MTSSINTNISALLAQSNIATAQGAAASSVQRLSSGNKIVQASDDVTALATGTALQTQVTALNTALTNASQGSSLLQVADGALSQVTAILQRQQAIALQAGSGSLTNTDRSYLNQEFQALSTEINQLSGATNFNGVNLLDGSLSTSSAVKATTTAATAGSLSTTFTDVIKVGENVNINGTILTAVASGATGNQFNIGATTADTVSNLAARLNVLADNASYNNTIGSAVFSASSQTLTATARSGGTLSNAFTLANTAPAAIVTSNLLTGDAGTSNNHVITVASSSTFAVGQRIIYNGANSTAVDGMAMKDFRGTIVAIVDATHIKFNGDTGAVGGAGGGAAVGTVSLDMANSINEANTNGGSIGSSFNLFATTTGFTSATTVISAATATADAPFKNGDSLTATVGGTANTLYTFGTGATLTDLVNGINANTGATGFKAALTYNGSTYNVRLDSASSGNILLNGGANYYTTAAATNPLAGSNLTATTNNIGIGTWSGNSIISAGYIDLFTAGSAIASAATTATAAAAGVTAAIPFEIGANLNMSVNGTTQTLHTFVTGDTFNSIVNDINANSATTGVRAAITSDGAGSTLNIRLFTNVPTVATDQVIVTAGAILGKTIATANTLTAGALTQTTTATLAGGADNGIGQGSTSVTGTVGDTILQTLGTTHANASILVTSIPTANDTIVVAGQTFYFTANTTNKAANEITIGSSIQQTVNNAVSAIQNYAATTALGDVAYQLNQMNVSGTSNGIVFTGKGLGTVTSLAGAATTITGGTLASNSRGALVGGTMSNGSGSGTFGVDVTGISNSAFTGALSGFTATYDNVASTVDVSIKVGNNTYTAKSMNANTATDQRIRFYSDTVNGVNGGYFDVQLKANQVTAFSDQAGANTVANRLNSAFSSLNFNQTRNLNSYTGNSSITANGTVIGSLINTKVSAQLANFSGVNLSDVQVAAPSGSATDAKITLVIGGVNYTSAAGIGSVLGSNQTYKLTNATDPNQFVNFTTGSSTIDLSSSANALAVQNALKTAFGATAGSSALSFQIGSGSTDTLAVSIGSATTSTLYGGQSLDVLTQQDASAATAQLTKALDTITTMRSSVGALEERFNYASAAIQSAVQNQDAARSSLLDTNVATESTAYATTQVKMQAGISVLAQANQQLQLLLKLIQ